MPPKYIETHRQRDMVGMAGRHGVVVSGNWKGLAARRLSLESTGMGAMPGSGECSPVRKATKKGKKKSWEEEEEKKKKEGGRLVCRWGGVGWGSSSACPAKPAACPTMPMFSQPVCPARSVILVVCPKSCLKTIKLESQTPPV